MATDSSAVQAPANGRALNWDLFEKIVVVALLGTLAMRMVPAALESGAYQNWLILLAEACVAFFVLIRRGTTNISLRPMDWILAFGGTFSALLVIPASGDPVLPIAFCGFLMMAGLIIQLWAKFTLRRSFGVIAANRGVKISGPYRMVRHPMYAGYTLTHVGFLLSGPNLWNILVYALVLGLNVARIMAEERVLTADPEYRALSAKVRYRLIPFVF